MLRRVLTGLTIRLATRCREFAAQKPRFEKLCTIRNSFFQSSQGGYKGIRQQRKHLAKELRDR